jgi:hypothetical protein
MVEPMPPRPYRGADVSAEDGDQTDVPQDPDSTVEDEAGDEEEFDLDGEVGDGDEQA